MTHTCECTSKSHPFHCPRFNREMGKETHAICQGRTFEVNGKAYDYDQQTYLATWVDQKEAQDAEKLPPQYFGEPEVDRIRFACAHLGELSGETMCACGGGKKPTPIADCEKFGSCSPLANSIDRSLRACKTCNAWIARATPEPLKEVFANWSSEATSEKPKPEFDLTVGVSLPPNEEYSAVWATFNSILAHHAEALKDLKVQFLVIDGNPGDKSSQAIKAWIERKVRPVATGKYVEYNGPGGTAQPRNEIFRQADGEIVLTFDPHVLLETGTVRKMLDYFKDRPACKDLLTGPQIDDSGTASYFQRLDWGGGALGIWTGKKDVRPDHQPFPIPQQGLGCFAMRRDAWPEFHASFREFGGCETYLCEKVRRFGGQVMCHPAFRWRHRFQRPWGVTYAASLKQRLKNYLIGFAELGMEDEIKSCLDHYRTWISREDRRRFISDSTIDQVIQEVVSETGATLGLPTPFDAMTAASPLSALNN